MLNLFSNKDSIKVRAYFLGQQIDLKPFSRADPLAIDPLVISNGQSGCAVLFDYGAAILFGIAAVEEAKFLSDIQGLVVNAFPTPETEDAVIRLAPVNEGKVEEGVILLAEFRLPSLQLVAEVLAKSVVLAEYESGAAQVFDQVEPFAASLQSGNFRRGQAAELLRQIGNSLTIQHKIVGRVEIVEKPELLWEYPELDRLYARLEDEYEIRERHLALERKLDLVSRTAETALNIQHQNTGLRLEWYVVILIVIEVLLSLYELFVA
ncbi:RMD1 family protein [Leptolyngbya sp. PCC 6406]|uniref:RMD1 family protein n=1 Tax=Leptolyngbya sp. PCC 6406 TaxID=1173264 RepID=UPI0002AC40B8|nr:RMD1 family protein [Leptolyngbya sp. PCC 6406]